jgi:hypothetical protein
MKSYSDLPFKTTNHEFNISWDKDKAYIKCLCKNDYEAFNNPISLEEFREMVATAVTSGVKEVFIDTQYSMEVYSQEWQYTKNYHNIKLHKQIKN